MAFGDVTSGGMVKMRQGPEGGSETVSGAHKRRTDMRWFIHSVRISHCVTFGKVPAWHCTSLMAVPTFGEEGCTAKRYVSFLCTFSYLGVQL